MDTSRALVELHLTPQGERALEQYVSGARFTAVALDHDPVGIWILSEAPAGTGDEAGRPSLLWQLLVKWDYIETLRIMYRPPEPADEARPA